MRALKSFTNETRRLGDWLLASAQIGAGPNRGAVAGWLDDRGTPAFAYPEATGYYLTWLAFAQASAVPATDFTAPARGALAWIERAFERPTPPATRIYADPRIEDWRNRATFCFDLAIVARGVACARELTGSDAALDRVAASLDGFAAPEGLRPVARLASGAALPLRWSTAAGPHLAKAAAAILALPTLRISAQLRAASERTYDEWQEAPAEALGRETHAVLYGAEGILLEALRRGDEGGLRNAARVFLHVSEPAATDRPDVAAQALRLGCALADLGLLDRARCGASLARLASVLRRSVSSAGSIVFYPEAPHLWHDNVWAAMFAHQALTFYEAFESGSRVPPRWLELLV